MALPTPDSDGTPFASCLFLHLEEGNAMSIAKVTEITSSSKESFEDAVREGIARASKTIANIRGAWINEQNVVVEGERITEWRVNMRVTFVLND